MLGADVAWILWREAAQAGFELIACGVGLVEAGKTLAFKKWAVAFLGLLAMAALQGFIGGLEEFVAYPFRRPVEEESEAAAAFGVGLCRMELVAMASRADAVFAASL